jgi:glucose dehydrogenase
MSDLLPVSQSGASGSNPTPIQHAGGSDSSQYSSLNQINKTTVARLKLAWSHPAGPVSFNPLVIDGTMYVLKSSVGSSAIVALDAATGRELWTHSNQGGVASRGMNYWESKDRSDRRLVYVNSGFLAEIDARTGETIASFGRNGRVDPRVAADRRVGLPNNHPGRIVGDTIIVSLPATSLGYDSTPGDVHAYDVVTGNLKWIFHSVPLAGEAGSETWPAEALATASGVHNWSELTVDEQRGIVYVPFGTARYDFYGANRKGNNLFANSLVALDAKTGKRLWHYQVVHHDLWDYDLPAAPKLLTVRNNGRNVDVVVQPTKHGFLFVFDRVSGKPLWPIEERRVPQSDVPGEETSPTQPFPTVPPPFARQSFTEKDINPFLPEAERAAFLQRFRGYRNEGLFTPPSIRGTIAMPGHLGGANWGSSAVDPTKGTMYVVSKEMPVLLKLNPAGANRYDAPYDFLNNTSTGMSVIGPPWSQLTAYDLNAGKILWQVPHGSVAQLGDAGKNQGSAVPRGGVVATAGGLLFIATSSDQKFRAYDQADGKVLWEYNLPSPSEGIPAVYEVAGRQYIALPVGGAGLLQPRAAAGATNPGGLAGQYMVFALP